MTLSLPYQLRNSQLIRTCSNPISHLHKHLNSQRAFYYNITIFIFSNIHCQPQTQDFNNSKIKNDCERDIGLTLYNTMKQLGDGLFPKKEVAIKPLWIYSYLSKTPQYATFVLPINKESWNEKDNYSRLIHGPT